MKQVQRREGGRAEKLLGQPGAFFVGLMVGMDMLLKSLVKVYEIGLNRKKCVDFC
jgi:hypothetical protein